MNGLSSGEASERRAQSGPTALPERPPEPLWKRFLRQFNSPLIFILLFALAFEVGLWICEGARWPWLQKGCPPCSPSRSRWVSSGWPVTGLLCDGFRQSKRWDPSQ
jgi:magnesium-transporting ATPase (P-type)